MASKNQLVGETNYTRKMVKVKNDEIKKRKHEI